jgi:hypothetical protein
MFGITSSVENHLSILEFLSRERESLSDFAPLAIRRITDRTTVPRIPRFDARRP